MCYQTFEQLKEELEKINVQGNYFFRGYVNDNELQPLICREPYAVLKEETVLNKFKETFKIYASASTFLDFLSVAQHYGLATCLLDFTTNPYVALSFAMGKLGTKRFNIAYIKDTDAKDVTDELQAIPFSVVEETLIIETMNSTQAGQSIKELGKFKEDICYIRPNISSQRMMMQDGVFFIADNNDIEAWKSKLESKLIILECDFSDAEIVKAKEYLRTVHCDFYRLMPDLAGLCNAINNDILIK